MTRQETTMPKIGTMPHYVYQKNVRSAAKHRQSLQIHQEEKKPENEIDKECRESGNDKSEDDVIAEPHDAFSSQTCKEALIGTFLVCHHLGE